MQKPQPKKQSRAMRIRVCIRVFCFIPSRTWEWQKYVTNSEFQLCLCREDNGRVMQKLNTYDHQHHHGHCNPQYEGSYGPQDNQALTEPKSAQIVEENLSQTHQCYPTAIIELFINYWVKNMCMQVVSIKLFYVFPLPTKCLCAVWVGK